MAVQQSKTPSDDTRAVHVTNLTPGSANPPLGLGHVAHFYEFMILKLLAPDTTPLLPGHDVHALFDSFRAAHDDRWKPRDVVVGRTHSPGGVRLITCEP